MLKKKNKKHQCQMGSSQKRLVLDVEEKKSSEDTSPSFDI